MRPRSKRQCRLNGKSRGRRRTAKRNAQAWCRLYSKAGRILDRNEIRQQEDLPPDLAFRTLRPAGTPWTLSSIRIEGAVLWVVTCIDDDDLWGPRIGVTVLPDLNAKATSRPIDAWVLFGHDQRVIGALPNEIEAKVVEFVDQNLEVLLAHWEGKIDSVELVRQLRIDATEE